MSVTIKNTRRGTSFAKESITSNPTVKTDVIVASNQNSKTHQWERSEFIRAHHSGATGVKADPIDPHTDTGKKSINEAIKKGVPEDIRVWTAGGGLERMSLRN